MRWLLLSVQTNQLIPTRIACYLLAMKFTHKFTCQFNCGFHSFAEISAMFQTSDFALSQVEIRETSNALVSSYRFVT